jgi:NADPH-dependent 2,4-dienoyl-CoA reductase/sulfur reductase-like enzyme/rhodanese-related sulfurtransferase
MKNKKRILIVGGVAGGASAAARARRLSEDAEIILFERGPYVSFANCGLPYYISGEITERKKLLVLTPQRLCKRFNIDVRINSEVIAIDRDKQEIAVKNADREYHEKYDVLVLSPGANPIRPNIPGIANNKVFSLRNIPDMDAINNNIKKQRARSAVIVGGGYIGLEMAEALRKNNLDVIIVELTNQVMGTIDPEMATLLHQELKANDIDLRLGTSVTGFVEGDHGLEIQLSNGDKITTDFAVLAIGVKPENKLAKEAGLKIGKLGGIVVNENMQTSDQNIYAVGDAIEVKDFVSKNSVLIPLAGPANRQGRIAADNIFGRKTFYHDTQGTGVCRVFKQTVAMTGLNEKALKKYNISYEKIYLYTNDHADYYPHATPINLKLLFNPKSGKILGAQAIGQNGVDKRIDLLAMAIRAGLTVFDLEETELCYAPPYGSAKDVINYAGFVAANVIKADVKIFHVEDIINLKNNQILLDVRTAKEFAAGTITNAINIPIDELRDRLNEIPNDKEILVFCRVGTRSYLACRILMQHGFNCRSLTGGYLTYLLS